MRPIRFRAWHEATSEVEAHMDYNPKVMNKIITAYEARENIYTMDTERVASFRLNDAFIQQEGVIVMLSTGLKDKNGKEIFEGDIVKEKEEISAGGKGRRPNIIIHIGEIFWSDDFAGFMMKNNQEWESGIGYPKEIKNKMKVIGNLYENPNLLPKD